MAKTNYFWIIAIVVAFVFLAGKLNFLGSLVEGPNMLTNGDFSSGLTGWTSYAGTLYGLNNTFGYTAAPSVMLRPDSAGRGVNQINNIPVGTTVKVGDTVRLSGYARHGACTNAYCWVEPTYAGSLTGPPGDVYSGTEFGKWDDRGGARLVMEFKSGTSTLSFAKRILDWTTASNQWTLLTMDAVVPTGATSIAVWMQGFDTLANGNIYFDDIKFSVLTEDSTCSDGTLNGACSATKPLYCSSGTLIDNCVSCGCSSGTCNTGTGICDAPCVDTTWAPATDTVCSGTTFTRTSNCGNTRTAIGTKSCPSCGMSTYITNCGAIQRSDLGLAIASWASG